MAETEVEADIGRHARLEIGGRVLGDPNLDGVYQFDPFFGRLHGLRRELGLARDKDHLAPIDLGGIRVRGDFRRLA